MSLPYTPDGLFDYVFTPVSGRVWYSQRFSSPDSRVAYQLNEIIYCSYCGPLITHKREPMGWCTERKTEYYYFSTNKLILQLFSNLIYGTQRVVYKC